VAETAPVSKPDRIALLLGFVAAVVGLPMLVITAGSIGGPDADRTVFGMMWIAWFAAIPAGLVVNWISERWPGSPTLGQRGGTFLAVLWITAFPVLCMVGFAGEQGGWLPTGDCSKGGCDGG